VKRLTYIIALPVLLVSAGLAVASVGAGSPGLFEQRSHDNRVAQAKKSKKSKKAKGKATKGKGKNADGNAADALFDAPAPAATPAPAPPAGAKPPPTLDLSGGAPPAAAPVLDLSGSGTDAEAARQEMLQGADSSADDKTKGKGKKKGKKGKKGEFDFGGGVDVGAGSDGSFDFGSDLGSFDINFEVNSAERERFDKAIKMMSDEEYARASLEFKYFLEDPKFTEFLPESDYQLAKALYKLGFINASLTRFQAILDKGPAHRRYKKSVEWLFFISRKMADQTPVLAELARFRNVNFPKAYRNEYRYLLSKYLFQQGERFEVERVEAEELARQKKSKSASFDFGSAADAIDSGTSFDFSGAGDGGFDFGSPGGGGSSGGSFDFGGGGGAGAGDAGGGGAIDFGGGGGGGGLDFGGGGGGLDFGGGAPPPTPGKGTAEDAGPVRDTAPQTAAEAMRQGLDLVTQVEPESRYYARAKYLEGLIYYLQGSSGTTPEAKEALQKAVGAFEEVVRVLNPREGKRLDPKLREQAFLSLARIFYGNEQFNNAAFYYDLIDRDSENWLTSLFEAAWAYYRRGDYEKALGNLLTLHSPFFEKEYFPESQLVKSIIYFEACRYDETKGFVDDFLKRFSKVMKEIEKIADSKDAPETLYDRITQMQKASGTKAEDDITSRVVSLALADAAIRTARDVVQQATDQLDIWAQMSDEFRQSRLGRDLYDEMKLHATDVTRQAGEVTKKKFEKELYDLKSLLAQALRIKLEVAKAEQDIAQRKLNNEKSADAIIPAEPRTVVGDEQLYWPYEGEYWRDELGTYELDFSMCRPLAAVP
jgi:outer membrane protein assembly factor BamD (BamD/ComL family)